LTDNFDFCSFRATTPSLLHFVINWQVFSVNIIIVTALLLRRRLL